MASNSQCEPKALVEAFDRDGAECPAAAGQGGEASVELSEERARCDIEQAAPAAMFDELGIVQGGERQPAAAGRGAGQTG
jgi:hypothetical protein